NADRVRDLDLRAHRRPLRAAVLPFVARGRAFRRLRELFFELLVAGARLPDGVDLLLDLARPLGDALVGDLLVVEDYELANCALARVKLIAQEDHLARDERRARDR